MENWITLKEIKKWQTSLDTSRMCLLTGLPGEGKSLIGAQRIMEALMSGYIVYSNMWINWDNEKAEKLGLRGRIYYYKDFDEILHIKNCLLFCDEIAIPLDSRRWENESPELRKFIMQHRHRHVEILVNTQMPNQVALTVRNVVSLWIECRTIKKNFYGWRIIRKAQVPREEFKSESPKALAENILGIILNRELEFFNEKRFLRPELDPIKCELEHDYCPKCRQRQDQREKLLPNTHCECCGHQLIKRKSGIYDTDFDIIVENKKIMQCRLYEKKETWVLSNKPLGEEQVKAKKILEYPN